MPTNVRVLIRVVVGLAVAPTIVGAQVVRGVVHDSALAQPLAGAVVSLVDSLGNATARTIADGSGAFALARAARAVRVRAIRIGYVPRELPLERGAGDLSVSLAMLPIPPVLDAVRVSETELCPGSPDRGPAFQLWEQARTGLLATVVARDAKPAAAATLVFERSMEATGDLVLRQVVSSRHGNTTKPFTAAHTPSAFALHGYVEEEPSGARTYNAPDDDVLLDPSFAATHCFHLRAEDAEHSGQIGLAFTPVPGRDTLIDVEGVIWMDRTAPALRSLDFRYTGLEPAAMRAGTGGHLEFRAVANGVVFIERWILRLPNMERRPPTAPTQLPPVPGSGRRQTRFDMRITGIVEHGGQVLEAHWRDGVHWQAPVTGLSGMVFQKGSRDPVPYAIITLRGTNDSITADARGHFQLSPLVAGRYAVQVSDTTLAAYAAERSDAAVVEVKRGEITAVNLELPSLRPVLAGICKDQRRPANTATLIGRITLRRGDDAQGGTVQSAWQADYSGVEHADDKVNPGLAIINGRQTTTVDRLGRFVVCGVAIGRPVTLHFTQGEQAADTIFHVGVGALQSVDWRPR